VTTWRGGIRVIQIDERPAGGSAAAPGRLAGLSRVGGERIPAGDAGVSDATQIHTHMCYSEFNDVIA